jgi:ATP adenylyltransferase
MRDTAISTQSIDLIGRGRFQDLLSGTGRDCDHVLFEAHGCVVAPTLGSIIPNWILIVPRRHAVSFRDWQAEANIDPVRLVDEALAMLDIKAGPAIWFEHGPATADGVVGCGVDHAHLHVLINAPFSFGTFAAASMARSPVDWYSCPAAGAYSGLTASHSYLLAGSNGDAVAAEHVDIVGSQFFRRVIAELVGRPDQWNYKTHAHMENVRRTVSTFTQKALAIPL